LSENKACFFQAAAKLAYCCLFVLGFICLFVQRNPLSNMKKTLVLGASPNPARYAYRAVIALHHAGHPVYAVGKQTGHIQETPIHRAPEGWSDVDTVTLYLNPRHQEMYYQYILDLKPNRVIFNPGTENPDFAEQLQQHGIAPIEACTLVMLAIGNY
jgi:hypothetical protein